MSNFQDKAMKHFLEILTLISDSGNVILSKFINYFGAVSIGTGATLGAISVASPGITLQSSLPVIAAIVSIIGGLTFILKNVFDMWLSYQKHRKP